MKLSSLALLLLIGAAHGACPAVVPTTTACVQWLAPTKWSDETPITTPISYNVWRLSTTVPATVTLIKQTSATDSGVLPAQPRGKQCYIVTAVVLGVESTPSNQGCKKIGFPGPTDGKIEGPTDGSIEPKN